jgi:anti-sigma-K factor RskA
LASVLFLMFGLWMLFDSALGWRSVAVTATAAVALAAATLAARRLWRRRAEVTVGGGSPDGL